MRFCNLIGFGFIPPIVIVILKVIIIIGRVAPIIHQVGKQTHSHLQRGIILWNLK